MQPCRISLGDDTSCALLSSDNFSAEVTVTGPLRAVKPALTAPSGPCVVACLSLREQPSWVHVPKLRSAGKPGGRVRADPLYYPGLVWFYARVYTFEKETQEVEQGARVTERFPGQRGV